MSKYRAIPTVIDGIRFASKKEANRYGELKLLFVYGKIASLETQPKFKLAINGEPICTYVADFKYIDLVSLKTVIEDVKGMKTPVYRLKKKLMKAIHGIEIQEV